MGLFLSGAYGMGLAVAGLFFFTFWKKTQDKLFLSFGIAFWLMTMERIPLAFVGPTHEGRPYIYFFRLVANLLIILAIIEKNRSARPKA